MLLAHEDSDVEDFVVMPGGVVTWTGEIPPTPIKFPEPNPGQLQLVVGLLDEAISGVTISSYASGLPIDRADRSRGTARGIQLLQQAAGDTISFFKDNFGKSILMLGRMYLSNNQQFWIARLLFL